MADAIDIQRRDHGVAVVTLQNAERMNSFDPALLARLHADVLDLLDDPDVRGIVLTGTGRAFCAGADIQAFRAAIDRGDVVQFVLDATEHLHPLLRALYESQTVLVAAVNGVAAGGGLGLALVADARIGTRDARFAASYFRIGASPDGGATWLMPRVIGEPRTRRFFFHNEVMDAEEALRTGLLDRIVGPEKLIDEAAALAAHWGSWARHSRAATKRLLAQSAHTDFVAQLEAERGLIAASVGTADFREGIAAFLAKREPRFS